MIDFAMMSRNVRGFMSLFFLRPASGEDVSDEWLRMKSTAALRARLANDSRFSVYSASLHGPEPRKDRAFSRGIVRHTT